MENMNIHNTFKVSSEKSKIVFFSFFNDEK